LRWLCRTSRPVLRNSRSGVGSPPRLRPLGRQPACGVCWPQAQKAMLAAHQRFTCLTLFRFGRVLQHLLRISPENRRLREQSPHSSAAISPSSFPASSFQTLSLFYYPFRIIERACNHASSLLPTVSIRCCKARHRRSHGAQAQVERQDTPHHHHRYIFRLLRSRNHR